MKHMVLFLTLDALLLCFVSAYTVKSIVAYSRQTVSFIALFLSSG